MSPRVPPARAFGVRTSDLARMYLGTYAPRPGGRNTLTASGVPAWGGRRVSRQAPGIRDRPRSPEGDSRGVVLYIVVAHLRLRAGPSLHSTHLPPRHGCPHRPLTRTWSVPSTTPVGPHPPCAVFAGSAARAVSPHGCCGAGVRHAVSALWAAAPSPRPLRPFPQPPSLLLPRPPLSLLPAAFFAPGGGGGEGRGGRSSPLAFPAAIASLPPPFARPFPVARHMALCRVPPPPSPRARVFACRRRSSVSR